MNRSAAEEPANPAAAAGFAVERSSLTVSVSISRRLFPRPSSYSARNRTPARLLAPVPALLSTVFA
jgi:hypothetical protein